MKTANHKGYSLIATLVLLLALSAVAAVGLRQAHNAMQNAWQEYTHIQLLERAHLGLVNTERSLQNLAPLTAPAAEPHQSAWPAPLTEVETFARDANPNDEVATQPLYRIRSTAQNTGNATSFKRVQVRLESIFMLKPYPQRLSWRVVYD